MTIPLTVHNLAGGVDAEWCARVMATSQPWLTLGRGYEVCLRLVLDPTREVHVATTGDERVGFYILFLAGPLNGYLQTIAVAPGRRGQGIGARLLALAEERMFAVSPNALLCVSSFNPDARRLYQRAGYTLVGELTDFPCPRPL